MAQPSIVLYHRYEQYEWATKYYFGSLAQLDHEHAQDLAQAEMPFTHEDVRFNRWEGLNADGQKIVEGELPSVTGASLGEIMPIKYALNIRLLSVGPGRPSTKYLHGYSEAIVTNGELNNSAQLAVTAYGNALAAIGVLDSDGANVTGAVFRQFSRRRRMRRIP